MSVFETIGYFVGKISIKAPDTVSVESTGFVDSKGRTPREVGWPSLKFLLIDGKSMKELSEARKLLDRESVMRVASSSPGAFPRKAIELAKWNWSDPDWLFDSARSVLLRKCCDRELSGAIEYLERAKEIVRSDDAARCATLALQSAMMHLRKNEPIKALSLLSRIDRAVANGEPLRYKIPFLCFLAMSQACTSQDQQVVGVTVSRLKFSQRKDQGYPSDGVAHELDREVRDLLIQKPKYKELVRVYWPGFRQGPQPAPREDRNRPR